MDLKRNETAGVDARREAEVRLRAIPNVGPAIAADLIRLGITRLEDMTGRDPEEMYETLCVLDGLRHDPCVRDVFAAVTAIANGEEARVACARRASANDSPPHPTWDDPPDDPFGGDGGVIRPAQPQQ